MAFGVPEGTRVGRSGLNQALRKIAVLAVLALVAGCGTAGFNLPPVSATDGQRLPGKIIWHDLLADAPDQTREFYGALFGWEFEPVPGGVNYELIRHRGRLIGGMVDQNRLPKRDRDISQWVVVMSVSDIDVAVDSLLAAGGRVYTQPASLGDRGDIAVVADPGGALLALLQTRDGDPADREATIPTGGFLWDELWSEDPPLSSQFYRSLAPLVEEIKQLEGVQGAVDYRVLSSESRPRLGIRSHPDPSAFPATWVSYLRVADEEELANLLARVELLGGTILVPALRRPGGGSVAVITDPSGAGIALQTWPGDRIPGSKL